MRKGQTINIDWTVGLGLFLITTLTAVIFLINVNAASQDRAGIVESKALEVQNNLKDAASVSGRKIPVISRGPTNISNIPLDRYYQFPSKAYPDSSGGTIPVQLNISKNRIVAITDSGNLSNSIIYFTENVSNTTYESDIQAADSWINNSKISVKIDGTSLTSLKVSGQEIISTSSDLGSGDSSVKKSDLYAETLSGNFRVYNNSSEIIIDERSNNITFDLKDFDNLYWYENDTSIPLTGTGLKAEGETKGFTVASEYGITFLGEMSATVTKPDSSTVRAELDAEKARIRLHNSNYKAGKKRIKFYDKGYLLLGASHQFSAPYKSKIKELDNLQNIRLEDKINSENFGYNISFGEPDKDYYLKKGQEIPLGSLAIVSDRTSELIRRNGTFKEIESRVVLWP